ncbi:(d)CMP kinase [Estrella lausannensis]|uniref:Cytidylate kinase n=1 Tax=Estrella lausannensis TaxID=483423 RepID=A0A0H5DTE4_9BACT|nr:(d)CMP kinase [Estrella lausannensis]CRX39104.1 Cytidylate kinase [Estrella lausannensis]
MIITIDGPIATGKSSIAKKLARAIGFIYFDTGAMYRSMTWGLLKHNINPDDVEAVKAYLEKFDFDIKIRQGDRYYYVEGENITDAIRGEKVTSAVSKISAMKEVREKLMALQREFSIGVNAVFEGRDMGTVVFPDAEVKIFLTGRPEVRAKRRYDELKAKYPEDFKEMTMEKMLEDLNRRDTEDSTREIAPLRQAPDALVIDTSDLTVEEIIQKIQEFKDTRRTRLKEAT